MSTIQIPIPLFIPDASGNGRLVFYDASPHRFYVPGFDGDDNVAGYWYGHVRVPQDYASTPKIILALAANVTSGVARMAVSTYTAADAESYDGTYTTETAQDITMPGTAYLRKDVTFSLTTSGGLAAGDDLMVRIDHEGAHANDTLSVPDLLLVSCVFQYAT
jgi:hypothetical protein